MRFLLFTELKLFKNWGFQGSVQKKYNSVLVLHMLQWNADVVIISGRGRLPFFETTNEGQTPNFTILRLADTNTDTTICFVVLILCAAC